MQPMHYIGQDVHKRKISYCVKDSSGKIHIEGSGEHPRNLKLTTKGPQANHSRHNFNSQLLISRVIGN